MQNDSQVRRSSRLIKHASIAQEEIKLMSMQEERENSDTDDPDMNATMREHSSQPGMPSTSSAIEELQKQMQELRKQLGAATANAAAEKAERLRIEQLLISRQPDSSSRVSNEAFSAATTSSTSQDLESRSTATTAMCMGAGTTQYASHTHLSPSYPFHLPPATTTVMSTSVGTAKYASTSQPPQSFRIPVVPTFLSPLGATQPSGSQANPSSQSFTSPMFVSSVPLSQSSTPGNGRRLHDLPAFTGRPEEWPMFCTAYLESTAMFGYSNVENLFRLQKSIRGDAKMVVEALLIHPENVDRVMAALEFRFGRPECLLQSQLSIVREIAPIPESKLEMLIPFATRVQNLSTFLESSGMYQHLANPTLIDELVSKLPMSKRLEWAQQSINIKPYPTVKHFDNWLSEIARLVCLVTTYSLQPSVKIENKPRTRNMLLTSKTTEDRYQYQNHQHGTKVQPAAEQPSSAAAKKDVCRHCQGKLHPLANCQSFTNLEIAAKWNFVKKNRLCFSCLKFGHNVSTCRQRKPCGIDDCSRVHHPSLHEPKQSQMPSTSIDDNERAPRTLLSCNTNVNPTIFFRVLPVRLYNDDIMVKTFALLDEGSSVTIMDSDLAEQLRLRGQSKSINLQWFGKETSTKESVAVDLQISADKENAEMFSLNGVQTVRGLNLPIQTLTASDVEPFLHHLDLMSLAEYNNAKPKVLIGLEHCHLGAPIRVIRSNEYQPIVTETKLGWVVYGRSSGKMVRDSSSEFILHSKHVGEETKLDQMVSDFIELDGFGSQRLTKQPVSAVENRALRILSQTTKKVGARYETGLLWKDDMFAVPSSVEMAKQRLRILESKMSKNPEFSAAYKEIIRNYIESGYARKLTTAEAGASTLRTWYLPHFGVHNPNKPGKIRLVFDAAAKVSDTSINDFLLKGPDDLKPLLAILFNFRMRPVAVTGDIKEMFLQILIRQDDQDSQRFLWRDQRNQPIDVYVMKSMTFGATCSPCSANFVKNINAMKFVNKHPRAVEAIVDHHYVDDYVDSFDSEEEAIEVTKNVIAIHKSGGFQLRNFTSNSKRVLSKISDMDKEGETMQNVDMNIEATVEKVLGMCWNPTEDIFTFHIKFAKVSKDIIMGERCPTKREFLSVTMSIFDPLGMIANFVIHLKLLLRTIWIKGIGWDELIPAEVFQKWTSWKADLTTITSCKIPRCYSPFVTSANRTSLHIFVDASEEAFSAVGYLRIEEGKRITVSFVCGKTKTAPRKLMSIPRLELSAAILGIRLCNIICENHKLSLESRMFWSDSKTVLSWLKSDPRRHKPFVAFRIAEVLESSQCSEWHWVPTKLNPADDATRARYPPNYKDNKWLSGPSFLQLPKNSWPVPSDDVTSFVCEEEVRPKYLLHTTLVSSLVIDFSRYSKYSKLQRAMAWVIRFIKACQRKHRERGELSAAELVDAEQVLCSEAQHEYFSDEIAQIRSQQPVEKTSSIHKLTPYMDDYGLLRVYGRIDAATTIPFAARRPIILPKCHRLTMLIVDHFHRRLHHQNDETIATEIRQKFWVPSLRTIIRRVKNECQFCRIRSALPLPPLMGQLPEDRITPFVRPFSFTGLDYFGPVMITNGRHREKRWIALFTCLTVRALHLEVAADLSTDAFLLCLRNFVNRRGVPIRIRSDNGTNFLGAKNELLTNNIFDNEAIKTELSGKGIEWVFNCPSNPHAGGCWERLVRSVKRVLVYTLHELAPKLETLMSALIEAENIINSRPLTHLPVSVQDEEPLTPNHFLLGAPNSTQTPGPIDDRTLCARKQWRISQQIKDRFWRRWMREYLPMLTRRCKWFKQVPPIAVGDLVLVCDVDLPRSQWKRGRVIKVFPGQDDQVRSAEIKTSSGILRRPSVKLAVLDVSEASVGPERLTGDGML